MCAFRRLRCGSRAWCETCPRRTPAQRTPFQRQDQGVLCGNRGTRQTHSVRTANFAHLPPCVMLRLSSSGAKPDATNEHALARAFVWASVRLSGLVATESQEIEEPMIDTFGVDRSLQKTEAVACLARLRSSRKRASFVAVFTPNEHATNRQARSRMRRIRQGAHHQRANACDARAEVKSFLHIQNDSRQNTIQKNLLNQAISGA